MGKLRKRERTQKNKKLSWQWKTGKWAGTKKKRIKTKKKWIKVLKKINKMGK